MSQSCECGCGAEVVGRFKRGHNLRGITPGGAWKPGASPALLHGLRTRNPGRLVLDPIVAEIHDTLAEELPLKDAEGQIPAPDRFAVELAALALLRVRRCSAFLALHGDEDNRGHLRPEFDALGKAIEHAARMLDRLGCSPRARAALGVDVGRAQAFDLAAARARDLLGGEG